MDPTSLDVRANGLVHHVLAWPSRTEGVSGTVLLVHGFADAAATWDLVAPTLAGKGLRVFAPDMRGFGRAPRAGAGGSYHFVDYVADLADIVDALSPDASVSLVGHSMGGVISTLFAGSFPERVGKLAVLEGLGPPDNAFEVGPLRMRRWIEGTRSMQTRSEKAFTRTEALQRLVANHQGVDPSILEHRLLHLVDEVGEGLVRWRFDPLHRTTSPMPFFAALFREFARKVACPTLAVSGGPSGYHPPGEEERLAAFPSLRQLTIKDAGHMMHWTRPSEVAAALVAFL